MWQRRDATGKTYGKKGAEGVRKTQEAIDATLVELHEVKVPTQVTTKRGRTPLVAPEAPEFVQRVTAMMMAGHGDLLPVSAFPPDGTWPLGTARWEKRNIAAEIPTWDPDICIQCNKCVLACPHAAIRAKVVEPSMLAKAPAGYKSVACQDEEFAGRLWSLQVAPEDCPGCQVCVEVWPAKDQAHPRPRAPGLGVGAGIAWGTWGLCRDSVKLAVLGVPAGIDEGAVRAFIAARPGVSAVHDLHIWPMSTTETALTAHLVIPAGHPGDGFLHALAHDLEHAFGIGHATVQVETEAEACALESAGVI